MLLSIVLVKLVKVSEDLELNLSCPLISEFLALLLADITLEMLFSEMSIQSIVVIKVFVVAMVTLRMLLSLVLLNLITTV